MLATARHLSRIGLCTAFLFTSSLPAFAQSPLRNSGASSAQAAGLPASVRAIDQVATLEADDGSSEGNFGYSVSLLGNRALVGAPLSESGRGAAYVFVRDGSSWTQEAKLVADDGAGADLLGTAVSLSGDRALVGAGNSGPSGVRTGSAYVFVRDGSTWTQEAKLTAEDGADGDRFGFSVSLSGDRALVGAQSNRANPNGPDTGAAYVYRREGSSWIQEAKLVAADGAENDQFGASVSLVGGRALVGAVSDDDGGSFSGSAYVFVHNGSSWTQEAKLTAADSAEDDLFGLSVALSSDRALIGAFGDDNESGSAYTFVRTGEEWSQEDKFTSLDVEEGDGFGRSVALSGSRALVGANFAGENGSHRGAAYLFDFDGDSWTQEAKLLLSDSAPSDLFGGAVAFTEAFAVVGAEGRDMLRGAAFVFSMTETTSDEGGAESSFILSAAVPNPATRHATLTLSLASPEYVRASLIDAVGRNVHVIHDGETSGETRLAFDVSVLPPGLYVVRVEGETFAETRRLTVVR